MKKDNNFDFSTFYKTQNLEGMYTLIDAAADAINSTLIPQIDFEPFSDALCQFVRSLGIYESLLKDIDFDAFSNACEKLLLQVENLTLPSTVSLSLTDNITVNDNQVTITDDAIETLTDFFDENTEVPTPPINSKMSIKEFLINILLPLLCMLIPMVQSSYYHRLDSIESKQAQMQEAEYQKAILELETQHAKELEELNSNINELLQYLETVQDSDLPVVTTQSPVSDLQEISPESPVAGETTDDDSDNPNMNQSLN